LRNFDRMADHLTLGGLRLVHRKALAPVLLLVLITTGSGCGQSPDRGHFVDLPEHTKARLEFVVNDKENELSVYVVERDSDRPFPIACPSLQISFQVDGEDVPLTLAPNPRADDPDGKASRFTVPFDELPEQLYGAAEFSAKFTLELDGESVSGTLHHHDDHTHTHQHHD